MQRFRAALLALGLVALLAGMALGVLATQAVDKRDHDLGLAGASRVTAVDDYADRARAVTLLASHSAAFANFYQAPGSRMSRIEGRTGEPDLMPRVITALTDLENLFPDSIASASFIDRSGAENARVVGKSVMKPDELAADRSDAVFFDRAFQLPYDKVYQSAPYRSESTGDWVVANAAKVNIGPGVSPAIVSFEITLESIRLAAYSDNPAQQVRVVDLLDGRVVVDSKHPQDVNAPLGRPDDHSLRWVQTARDGVMRTRDHMRHVVRHARRDSNVATTWAVVVSTPARSGAWSGPFSAGPLGVAGAGVLLLFLSMVGYIRHGRSMHRAARRDELTGLFNRRAARECAETMLARERGLAVILFDLDRFKHVNDSLGHHAGDHLLSVLGQRLAEVVREPDDVVARLGGDEFVVLARGMHNRGDDRGALRATDPGRQRPGQCRRHRRLRRRQHRHRAGARARHRLRHPPAVRRHRHVRREGPPRRLAGLPRRVRRRGPHRPGPRRRPPPRGRRRRAHRALPADLRRRGRRAHRRRGPGPLAAPAARPADARRLRAVRREHRRHQGGDRRRPGRWCSTRWSAGARSVSTSPWRSTSRRTT